MPRIAPVSSMLQPEASASTTTNRVISPSMLHQVRRSTIAFATDITKRVCALVQERVQRLYRLAEIINSMTTGE